MRKILALIALFLCLTMLGCSENTTTVPTSAAVVVTPQNTPIPTPNLPSASADTFGETLSGNALEWYNWMPESNRNDIEFYASVFGYASTSKWILEALPELGNYGLPPPLTAPLPSLSTLPAEEQNKLETLDPRIRAAFEEDWTFGVIIQAPIPEPADAAKYVNDLMEERSGLLRERLMSIPSILPSAREILHGDALKEYEVMHPELQDLFWREAARTFATGQTIGRGGFPALNETQIKDLFSQHINAIKVTHDCQDHTKACL